MPWSSPWRGRCWSPASGDVEIGQVEPRIGARLAKLIKRRKPIRSRDHHRRPRGGARDHSRGLRAPVELREGQLPGQRTARPGDVRPYIKGTPLRYDDEEEAEEYEEETEEVEELDTTLPEFSAEPELEEELLEEP